MPVTIFTGLDKNKVLWIKAHFYRMPTYMEAYIEEIITSIRTDTRKILFSFYQEEAFTLRF